MERFLTFSHFISPLLSHSSFIRSKFVAMDLSAAFVGGGGIELSAMMSCGDAVVLITVANHATPLTGKNTKNSVNSGKSGNDNQKAVTSNHLGS